MLLEFRNTVKYYRDFRALDIPDLSLGNGIWWLEGENGSGKTTFLKMIAGIHPFMGDIILNNSLNLKKHRQQYLRRINYAEAEPLYPPFLTAKDLVELYLATKGGEKNTTLELLDRLHIADAYEKQVGTWSSGMVKKLSLALAFIGQPSCILLDEPLITLDVASVNIICDVINQTASLGVSFIITSHQTLHQGQLNFTGHLCATHNTISLL